METLKMQFDTNRLTETKNAAFLAIAEYYKSEEYDKRHKEAIMSIINAMDGGK